MNSVRLRPVCHQFLTFPSQRARALVLLQADEGAGPPVGAGAVPARVGGHGDLAEGGGVADGAGALKTLININK